MVAAQAIREAVFFPAESRSNVTPDAGAKHDQYVTSELPLLNRVAVAELL
jgi:hypothetical protein